MGLGLTAADIELAARALTSTDVLVPGDPSPVTRAQIFMFIKLAGNKVKRWERQTLPQGLATTVASVSLTTSPDVSITADLPGYDGMYRVDRLAEDGKYYPIEVAAPGDPTFHQTGGVRWREEDGKIIVGPPDAFAGEYEFHYFAQIDVNTAGDGTELIQLYPGVELVLVYEVCSLISQRMTNDPGKFPALADAERKAFAETIKQREGVHQQSAGLKEVLGW